VKLQEKALLQQKDEVDNSLEVIKENSKYLQKQIENNFQQMFESTFNTNLHQRFMIFDTFKTGNKEGSQIFREDIKHIITAYYNEHNKAWVKNNPEAFKKIQNRYYYLKNLQQFA